MRSKTFFLNNVINFSGPAPAVNSPEDFKKYIIKGAEGPCCGICYEFSHKSSYCVRNHIESKHYPNLFTYTCQQCDKTFGTNTALNRHNQRNHKILHANNEYWYLYESTHIVVKYYISEYKYDANVLNIARRSQFITRSLKNISI